MRALILSDIHANLEALEAVLADADQQGGFDVVWGLGDLVGYGINLLLILAKPRVDLQYFHRWPLCVTWAMLLP